MKRVLFILSCLVVATIGVAAGRGERATKAEHSSEAIADDPAVRRGVLRNGLSYYIRHNARPKGQADFYILSDVGAIQEEDDQQGLAHFMEHMAFNGTKNMPDKEVINYLESIGVKFGANLNAATSWDYTIYMMKDLPVQRSGAIDSALLILHDWAGYITPQPEEIDKERGVIKEELRTRDGASWRSTLSLIGALGRGTKYEHRNLIGYLEGLDSFEHEALERFYHDWYTPNHQAIIIVGDIDTESVEQSIQKQFKRLPAAKRNAPKKEVITVESNAEPLIEIFTDKEMQYSGIQYFIRRPAASREESAGMDYMRRMIEEALITQMQNSRLSEVEMEPNSPIISGGMSVGRVGVIPTLRATTYAAQSPEGGIDEALEEMVTQMERCRRYGFEEGEFSRAKENLWSALRSSYANRNDRTNNSFINRYVDNYRFGTPIPSAEEEWRIDSTLLANTSLEAVNRRVKTLFADDNHVVMINSPEKEGLKIPTKESLMAIIKRIQGGEVSKYEDQNIGTELLPEAEQLTGSKVIAESFDESLSATKWQLANGVEVVVRPSTLKADEVILRGYSEGGASTLSNEEYLPSLILSGVARQSGVGEYSAIDLERVLAGKDAYVSPWVSGYSHGFSGGSRPADLETLLQLLYLNFTSPRFSESDFEIYRRRLRSNNENQATDPDYLASKRFAEVAYAANPREMPLSLEMIDGLTLDAVKRARGELFSDADNFRFTIVGNVDLETLKPLVERYIGSLRVNSKNMKMPYVDDNIRPKSGMVRDDFTVRMEQPKVGVQILYSGSDIEFTMQNLLTANYLKAALDDLLLESAREQLGGTYGVGVSLSISKTPYLHYSLSIGYDTNEAQIEALQECIFEQLEKIATEGASQERMAKTREFLTKNFANTKERNSGWLSYIEAKANSGLDYMGEYEAAVESVTSEDVRAMARKIIDQKNRIEVIMHPKR